MEIERTFILGRRKRCRIARPASVWGENQRSVLRRSLLAARRSARKPTDTVWKSSPRISHIPAALAEGFPRQAMAPETILDPRHSSKFEFLSLSATELHESIR